MVILKILKKCIFKFFYLYFQINHYIRRKIFCWKLLIPNQINFDNNSCKTFKTTKVLKTLFKNHLKIFAHKTFLRCVIYILERFFNALVSTKKTCLSSYIVMVRPCICFFFRNKSCKNVLIFLEDYIRRCQIVFCTTHTFTVFINLLRIFHKSWKINVDIAMVGAVWCDVLKIFRSNMHFYPNQRWK